MRKLYVYVAMFAIGTMAACQKSNDVEPQGGNNVIDDNSPMAVQLGVKGIDMDVNVISKAQGSIEAWNAAQKLYVYAVDRADADLSEEPLIDNVSAMSPATGAQNNVLTLLDESGEYFYYRGSTVYDFYGYYVDDAAQTAGDPDPVDVVPTRNGGTITLQFTITGAQDIMLAKADPATDIADAVDATAAGASDVTEATAYSAFAARRGVQPTLLFEHQLARFVFSIVPGSESAKDVKVTAIKLESNTTGTLQIAPEVESGSAILNPGTPAFLTLANSSDGSIATIPYQVPAYSADPASDPIRVGESLMVIPGVGTYNLTVSMEQKGNGDTPLKVDDLETTIDAAKVKPVEGEEGSLTTFEKGLTYYVTIKVYGMEKIEVTADLNPWKDGGTVTIDPDRDMMPGQDDEEEQGGQDDQEQGGQQEP